MFIVDGLRRMFELVRGQIVNVPTDSPLSIFYIILNAFLLLFATIMGGSGSSLFSSSTSLTGN